MLVLLMFPRPVAENVKGLYPASFHEAYAMGELPVCEVDPRESKSPPASSVSNAGADVYISIFGAMAGENASSFHDPYIDRTPSDMSAPLVNPEVSNR
jgi:hypothetical protein